MKYTFVFLPLVCASILSAQPIQNATCVTSAVPPIVRAEGLTERIGDILYACTGAPNTTFTGNFSIALNANVTNRISANTTLTGIVLTADNGSGPQAINVQPILTG